MVTNYLKRQLSGSINGRPVGISAIASPGTAIHTAVTGNVHMDEVYLYLTNITTTAVSATIEQGGVSGFNNLVISIPPLSGSVLILPGIPINGGLTVGAFASVSGALNATGFVNRYEIL